MLLIAAAQNISPHLLLRKDGSLTLFLPKSDFDYCAKNYEYDPGNVIPSDAPQKFLSVRYADRIYGESKIAADGMISFNSDGTVFLDSDNHLWVIDYRYSDRDQAGFVQPSTQKRMLSDEYVKKTNKIAKQNFQESTKRKKGFFSKLFGKK